MSMSHVAIPAVLGSVGDDLLRTEVTLSLEGSLLKATALIDGGSTHSFVNPAVLGSERFGRLRKQ
jgi:hypothetical protein